MVTITTHHTALALQRLTEGLADVSLAITQSSTTDELFTLWSQFAPLMEAGLALQDRMANAIETLQRKAG